MKEICVVADGYPYDKNNHCVFVRELVAQIAKEGIKCSVIAPVMKTIGKKTLIPYHYKDVLDENSVVDVYRPSFTHFSSKPGLMGISSFMHCKAVLKAIKKENLNPNVIYGHFIYHNGLSAISVAKKIGAKSIIACGENSHRLEKGNKPYSIGLKWHNWKKKLSRVCGIICVSEENRKRLICNGFVEKGTRMCVIPNAVDTETFCVTDKREARKSLGFPLDAFIATFVGSFNDRKGNRRMDEALKDEKVKTVFVGSGCEFTPASDCIHCGPVKHSDLSVYLNASDMFVLPTTGEGCCNAIIEAVCCGLPVVSSKEPFNDGILCDDYSLRIDSMSVPQIKEAVLKLKNEKTLLEGMHKEAMKAAEQFSIEKRARKILDFIKSIPEG